MRNGRIESVPVAFRFGRVLMDVGGLQDDPRYEFNQQRTIWARFRPDGGIVVASYLELRSFSREGRWEWSFGREGGAPGEFRSLTPLCTTEAGEVISYDSRLQRLTIVGPDGRLVKVLSLSGQPTGGCLRDGAVVVTASAIRSNGDHLVPYALLTPSGTQTPLGRWPDRSMGPFSRPMPLAAGDRIMAPDRFQRRVTVLDRTGRVIRIFETSDPVRPMTDAQFEDAIRRGQPNATEEQRDILVANARRLRGVPEAWPSISAMMAGGGGWLWLKSQEALVSPHEWSLFDAAGVLQGRLRASYPPTMKRAWLVDVENDRALVQYRDDDDALHFAVLEVVRSTGSH